ATAHPLQGLTDMATIREFRRTERPKVVLTWAPHPKALPQAVANSFAEWSLAMGHDLTITHPPGYELSPAFTRGARIEYDPEKAYKNADFIYAKNWSSFADYGKITSHDPRWKVDIKKMSSTKEAYFMHCLPVRRNVVVDDEVIDSKHSLVIPQSNNRTFAALSVLKNIISNLDA
ncbi:MAG: acetylornithine carbamoyltransferase, partial [Saprospiraceae bacterium]|nr:acetylornithine carbamoyltransferase [Saprospiraceae bacterium]